MLDWPLRLKAPFVPSLKGTAPPDLVSKVELVTDSVIYSSTTWSTKLDVPSKIITAPRMAESLAFLVNRGAPSARMLPLNPILTPYPISPEEK